MCKDVDACSEYKISKAVNSVLKHARKQHEKLTILGGMMNEGRNSGCYCLTNEYPYNKWPLKLVIPQDNNRCSVCIVDNQFALLGGSNDLCTNYCNTCHLYRTDDTTWDILPP